MSVNFNVKTDSKPIADDGRILLHEPAWVVDQYEV